MGMTDTAMLLQSKRTMDAVEALLAAQHETNRLLYAIAAGEQPAMAAASPSPSGNPAPPKRGLMGRSKG